MGCPKIFARLNKNVLDTDQKAKICSEKLFLGPNSIKFIHSEKATKNEKHPNVLEPNNQCQIKLGEPIKKKIVAFFRIYINLKFVQTFYSPLN